MITYQFQFSDSDVPGTFVDPRDFGDIDLARKEAVRELSFMMSSRLPDGDHRQFSVIVTDPSGEPVYAASVVFNGQRFA